MVDNTVAFLFDKVTRAFSILALNGYGGFQFQLLQQTFPVIAKTSADTHNMFILNTAKSTHGPRMVAGFQIFTLRFLITAATRSPTEASSKVAAILPLHAHNSRGGKWTCVY